MTNMTDDGEDASSRGVKVIVAHVAAMGVDTNGVYHSENLAKVMAEYPNLDADISAMTLANHLADFRRVIGDRSF